MDNLFSKPPVLISFRQIYEQNIVPKLQEIDIFLKTSDTPYDVQHTAELLGMSPEEIVKIMTTYHIEHLDKLAFFSILSHSSSYISRLVKRQWKYVNTAFYTAPMIAYIYELNEEKVALAFSTLNKDCIPEDELLVLFEQIPMSIFHL